MMNFVREKAGCRQLLGRFVPGRRICVTSLQLPERQSIWKDHLLRGPAPDVLHEDWHDDR